MAVTAARHKVAPALLPLLVPIEELTLLPGNPRKGDVQAVARSLERFGQRKPITAQPDGTVSAGNHTLQAAKELGWTHIAVLRTDDDPLLAKAWALADNRTSDLATYDHEALAAMLSEVAVDVSLLEAASYSEQDLAHLLADRTAPELQIFSREEIVEAAFEHYRAEGFPYRKLARFQCMQEINHLAATASADLLYSRMGWHVADTYHPHRYRVRVANMKTPTEAFEDDRTLRTALSIDLEHVGTISSTALLLSRGIIGGAQAATNFRSGFALYLYRRFCPAGGTVLDTSAGFGGRLVGFLASEAALYIGIDPARVTQEANQRMVEELGMSDRVELITLPAEDVAHEQLKERCDFAFTSPPYFTKERYSEEESQSWKRYPEASEWRKGFLEPMLALQYAALKPGSFAAVNVDDVEIRGKSYKLLQWTLEAGERAGFEFQKRENFPIPRSPFGPRDVRDPYEPVLIFRKPFNRQAGAGPTAREATRSSDGLLSKEAAGPSLHILELKREGEQEPLSPIRNPAELTPIQLHGGRFYKREDLFQPFTDVPLSGGKVRQAMLLLERNAELIRSEFGGVVLTSSGVHSPQGLIIARVAREYGLRCVIFVGSSQVLRHPMFRRAVAAGAEIDSSANVGYESALLVAAKRWRSEHGGAGYLVRFGINLEADPEAILGSTAQQCSNLPEQVRTVVVPTGSGITAAGVILGLARYRPQAQVLAVQIADADRRPVIERIAPGHSYRWFQIAGIPYSRQLRREVADGFGLDPIYEAKAWDWMRSQQELRGEEVCFWAVGDSRAVRSATVA